MNKENLQEFENRIGYHFGDRSLLMLALTHSSYGHEYYHDKHHNN